GPGRPGRPRGPPEGAGGAGGGGAGAVRRGADRAAPEFPGAGRDHRSPDDCYPAHFGLPEWGSPRLPLIPESLILHHADDLDAKLEMYVRCLTRDAADG